MTDYNLKAANESTLTAALLDAGILTNVIDADTQETIRTQVANGYSLDIIGIIHKPTGAVTINDGFETPVMAALDGYHANLRADLTDEQIAVLPVIAAPNNPVRVWA